MNWRTKLKRSEGTGIAERRYTHLGSQKKAPVHADRCFSLSKKVTGRWPFFSLEILELRERMRYNSEG